MTLSHMSTMTPPRKFIRSANAGTRSTTQCHIKHVATKYCNTLQRTATHCNTHKCHPTTLTERKRVHSKRDAGLYNRCCKNTLQHTATHCNTLQHTQVTQYNSQRAQARALDARHSLLGAFSLIRFLFLHTASRKRRRKRHRRSHVR